MLHLRIFILLSFSTLFSAHAVAQSDVTDEWLTDYERSGYTSNPRYDETISYVRKLEKASPWIRLTSFGRTPQGRDLPLVILSKDNAFSPEQAHKTGRSIILIQCGIHPGEIDGKDAGLILLREIAITKSLARLVDNAVLLFMPILNPDGHERQANTIALIKTDLKKWAGERPPRI